MSEEISREEEMKRKFREALEKKKNGGRAGEAHLDANSSVNATHGAAGAKRTFRRKAGG